MFLQVQILKPMLKEDIDDDILNLLSNKDVPTKEKILTYLQKIDSKEDKEDVEKIKDENPSFYKKFFREISPKLRERGLPSKEIRNMVGAFAEEDKEEKLLDFYSKPLTISLEDIESIKAPVYSRFKEIGCEECNAIIDKIDFAGSAQTKGVGKEEYFLVAFYNNVKKKSEGDLTIGEKEYEVKGKDGIVSPHSRGSKADAYPVLDDLISNIEKEFKDIYKQNEEEIKNIKKGGEKWVSSIVNLGNKYFSDNIQKYINILEKSLNTKYKNIKLDNVLENNLISDNLVAVRIAQNSIDNAPTKEGDQFMFVSEDGKIKIVPNKDELKKMINSGINITKFTDLAPRLEYNGSNIFATKESKEKVSKEPKEKEKIQIQKRFIETSGTNRIFVSEEWLNGELSKKYKPQFDCTQKSPKGFCLLKPEANIEIIPI